MGLENKKRSSALGKDPLSRGIFSKTEESTESEEIINENQEESQSMNKSSFLNQESRIKNQESSFLNNREKEKVNLRLPIEINDWLDELVKQGKRVHGQKIPKELWVQAALELFQSLPIKWEEVDSIETLKKKLENQESRIKNQES
jgi:hypothetical protein